MLSKVNEYGLRLCRRMNEPIPVERYIGWLRCVFVESMGGDIIEDVPRIQVSDTIKNKKSDSQLLRVMWSLNI